MREYTDLEKIRLAKMERLRAAGMEPYPPRAGRTHTTAEALTDYQRQAPADAHTPHGNYTLAGRLRSVRVMGKAAFAHVEDGDGKLQLYFRADALGADRFRLFVDDFDLGDFLQASGGGPLDGEASGSTRANSTCCGWPRTRNGAPARRANTSSSASPRTTCS